MKKYNIAPVNCGRALQIRGSIIESVLPNRHLFFNKMPYIHPTYQLISIHRGVC
jgi:hypothetical protein